MTDEEKEKISIDILNYIKDKTPFVLWYENEPYNKKEIIKVVLNLIEKQQKEIENNDKKWQDKIKAKVIEVKDRPIKDEFITASQGKLNTIIELESLLDKE